MLIAANKGTTSNENSKTLVTKFNLLDDTLEKSNSTIHKMIVVLKCINLRQKYEDKLLYQNRS